MREITIISNPITFQVMRSLAFLVLSSALVQNIRALPVADDINQVTSMVVTSIIIDIMINIMMFLKGIIKITVVEAHRFGLSRMNSENDNISLVTDHHHS